MRTRLGLGLAAVTTMVLLVAACTTEQAPTAETQHATGIVVSLESPALGRVDSFELLTPDGETLAFDTSGTTFDPGFPVSHLSEHQLISEPVAVTYRSEDGVLVVTKLEDGS
jgi:hypothetical protein